MTATILETKNDNLMSETNPEGAKDPTPFLTINDESISLEKAVAYLRNSGLWPRVIGDIKRQHAIEKELEQKPEVRATKRMVNRAIGDLQLQANLLDPNLFGKWLQNNNLSYEDFYSQIAWGVKVEEFKKQLWQEEELTQYFEERKDGLDRLVLSRIVVATRAEAEEIKQQIEADPSRFEKLAEEKSLADDRAMGGRMGKLRRERLPKHVQKAIAEATPGQIQIIDPVHSEESYAVLKLHEIIEASLEQEALKQELRNEKFDRWMQEKLKTTNVSLAFEF